MRRDRTSVADKGHQVAVRGGPETTLVCHRQRRLDTAVADARLGITEVELCRQIQSRIVQYGADRADPIAMTFCRGEFNYARPPEARPLETGHYAWTDFRSTYGGYPADRNRIARGGEPESWEIEAYGQNVLSRSRWRRA